MASPIAKELEQHGIAVLPGLVPPESLAGMQRAFASRLRWAAHNDVAGYEKTERFRHMVQNVLTLHQGFVDLALHPLVVEAVREYVGPSFALVEAKGWLSLPTRKDFHGWHGDAWYDQARVQGIPREVKLGLYLTDVRSGAFNYLKGTHGRQAPHGLKRDEVAALDMSRLVEVLGPAGTVVLFDTSGVHRQSVPILEPRQAVFYCYHDPAVPLQKEDTDYNRYHPLLLNAALLGGLDDEARRILGFGDKTHWQGEFVRAPLYPRMHRLGARLFDARLWASAWRERIGARLRRLVGGR